MAERLLARPVRIGACRCHFPHSASENPVSANYQVFTRMMYTEYNSGSRRDVSGLAKTAGRSISGKNRR
jgi:hypothetical protein